MKIPLYAKYREMIMYVFVGGLTTVISFASHFLAYYVAFDLCKLTEGISVGIAVTISWISAVTFAFFTNKSMVFRSVTTTKKGFWREFFLFYTARLASLGVEQLFMFITVTHLGFNQFWMKIAVQVVILVLNYLFSKLVIFKKKKK